MRRLYIRGRYAGDVGTVAIETRKHSSWITIVSALNDGKQINNRLVDVAHFCILPEKFQTAPVGYAPKRFKLEGKYYYV